MPTRATVSVVPERLIPMENTPPRRTLGQSAIMLGPS